MTPEHKRLNMGCGWRKLNDHWNVDRLANCNPDQVLDFEQTPWPYEDDFFTRIYANNSLEHMGQSPRVFLDIIREMYRVSADQAEWWICVPHWRCDLFWNDFTHCRVITPETFRLFDQTRNQESIRDQRADSTFGLDHGIDLEVKEVRLNPVAYWEQQRRSGWIGDAAMDMKYNTLSNVAESIDILIRVHKPGRVGHPTV